MRALANDVLRRLERPLDALGLRAGIRHGERNDLLRAAKPEVLITTPESLDVMLVAREDALATLLAVVLDEAHLTYNTQRGLQIAVLLARLEDLLGHNLQVTTLSATVAADAEIWRFFRPGRSFVAVRDTYSRPIDAQLRVVDSPGELGVLLDRLSEGRKLKVLVFARSRRECDTVSTALSMIAGFDDRVFAHHSALSRDLRLRVEARFQEATSAICVATSTLELGIDIGDVDLVALYGPPSGWESFVQRIGRGNRRRDKANVLCLAVPGHGTTFGQLLSFETLLWQIRTGKLRQQPAMDLYGAAGQQLLSLVLERGGAYRRISELAEVFSPWRHLSPAVIQEIVAALVSSEYLRAHGFLNRVGATDRAHELHDLGVVWGNFPAGGNTVAIRSQARELGAVPVDNLSRIRPGVVIRFGGRRWRVHRVSQRGIEVEPARGKGNDVEISYGRRPLPLDPAHIEAMLLFIVDGIAELHMPQSTARWFSEIVVQLRNHVARDAIPFAIVGGRFFYFTFAGRLLNDVLALHAGSSSFRSGEVVLESPEPIDFTRLPTSTFDLLPLALTRLVAPPGLTVFQQLLPGDLLRKELGESWLKSPVYGRSVERLRSGHLKQVSLSELDKILF